ncbi:formimidoylglutamate deiminase [Nitratireductor mangrovi]|uniref:Formimidoylglutamate deiminase n=1 Tax=Nitratireductor mangrovi TaxID=2599600 RepID=A0A5B8L2K5_9HYPH|nr:formimidoylglutamate deiminase [Nitratireductor mangrovi]QDZ01890.1 formimidoylglutamate deiminase [Nitratireductor mangrovi]
MATIFARRALTGKVWQADVVVEIAADGRIADVSSGVHPGADNVSVDVLLPAPANLHSHTFQRAMAGLSEARGPSVHDSFWTWREIMYRFLDILSPEEIEAIAALAFMEMQEAGFAAAAEFHYLHHRPRGLPYDDLGELSARIAAAAGETGIGLTLLPVHYAQGGVDGRPLGGGQLRFGNDLDRYMKLADQAAGLAASLPADAATGLAPHSLRAVGASDLKHLAEHRGTQPFHMHIAEQEKELEETLAAYGARPVEWLLDNVAVDHRWCLIHCTHMQPAETEGLAASGAVAGLCPVTEANLGDGIFDGARFLAAGGAFGIGSDSNIRITVAGELRQLEYSQRLRDRLRVVLAGAGESSGRKLYDTALAGGARALGRQAGAIAPGMWADLVALDLSRSSLFGLDADRFLDGWLFAGGNDAVSDVWSAGRHMVRDGRHVRRDAITARYRKCMNAVMARL